MKVEVLKGKELLFIDGCHFDKDIHKDEVIVNLNERWGYISSEFIQSTNTLHINLVQGEVALTFSEQLKNTRLNTEEKDQLIFSINK